jgi:hypothetical protein
MILSKHNEVVALAQVRIVTLPFLYRGIAYVANGPVWRKAGMEPDPLVFEAMLVALLEVYALHRKLLLRISPYIFSDTEGKPQDILARIGFQRGREDSNHYTIIVDISRSLQEIRDSLDKEWRRNLRRGEEKLLEILEGTSTNLFKDFLPVYLELLERKKLQPEIDYLRWIYLQSVLPESERPKIFLAYLQGNVVAGLVVSALGNTGYPIVAATHREGMKLHASYLLHWRAIEWLKECGCHNYDLVTIEPEKNPGTYQFKKGLRGKEVSMLGVFEYCCNPLSRILVRSGEPLREYVRKRILSFKTHSANA